MMESKQDAMPAVSEPVAPALSRPGRLSGQGLAAAAILAFAVAMPAVIDSRYWVNVGTGLLINLVLVLGLNIMMGYAGQLVLGYAAFVGISAYGSTLAMAHWHLPWLLGLAVGVAAAVALGLAMGLPTLKLNPVYLSIVTLALGQIFVLLIFNFRSLTGGGMGLGGVPRPSLFGVTFTQPIPFYYLMLAFAVLLIFTVLRLESSRFGRAFEYLREDETAAEASGIDTVRTKLLAFTAGAVYAGIGGVLLAAHLTALGPNSFGFSQSILYLIMVVVGGTGSVAGALAGGAAFTLLPEVLRGFVFLRMLVYGAGLAAIMLFRPQGLIPPRRRPLTVRTDAGAGGYTPAFAGGQGALAGQPLLAIDGVTKRFAGLTAVKGVSLELQPGELVSIIGPNGAGKTTLVNLITGMLPPTEGRVLFRGGDITRLRPNRRARMGIARTFQKIRLFPNLTLMENVVAGRQVHARAGMAASILRTPAQRREEAAAVHAADYWLRFVGDDLYERRSEIVRHLPYGAQKRVEIARALALEPTLLILDEPAAGLNSAEKERLAGLIKQVQSLGVTVILIEHDMRMVMRISDRIFVLDNGEKIAEGGEAGIRSNPQVVEAYLGRDAE